MAASSTSFKKGENHNPKGRPKRGYDLIVMIDEALEGVSADGVRTRARAMVEAMVSKAAEGDPDATKEVLDRMLGKAKQSMELSTPDERSVPERIAALEFELTGSTPAPTGEAPPPG